MNSQNSNTKSSIGCKVSNCTHYSHGICEASHIDVQGTTPTSGAVNSKKETCCDTFRCK